MLRQQSFHRMRSARVCMARRLRLSQRQLYKSMLFKRDTDFRPDRFLIMGSNYTVIIGILFILVSNSMLGHALKREPINQKSQNPICDSTILKEIENNSTGQQKNTDQDLEMLEKLLNESIVLPESPPDSKSDAPPAREGARLTMPNSSSGAII